MLFNSYAWSAVAEGHARHDIGTIKLDLGEVVHQIKDIFEEDNPNFNSWEFIKAVANVY